MKPSEETVRLFEKDRFATDNGAVIEDVSDHYAKCVLKVEDRHRNAMGSVMGGVYFTLADFAFAVAANWQAIGTVSLKRRQAGSGGFLYKKRENHELLSDRGSR